MRRSRLSPPKNFNPALRCARHSSPEAFMMPYPEDVNSALVDLEKHGTKEIP